MERHFEEELKSLKAHILDMGGVAQSMIHKAVEALKSRDERLTLEVFELEKKINQMHIDTDDKCLKLLALHQPMAMDLRLIMAAMKINSDLERIGDQATNASQTFYYHLFKEADIPAQTGVILRMAEISQAMLRDSLAAFDTKDVKLAQGVLLEDQEVDRLKSATLTECIALIRQNPPFSKQFVDIILLSKNMERIADHATNIAEDVVFMVLGKDIRHHAQETAAAGAAV
jgi:phosphate transport system protein